MSRYFVIEDKFHAEHYGEYVSLDEAWKELRRRAAIEWDQPPNVAPCTSWKTCGRSYSIIEYENSGKSWEVIRRIPGFVIDSTGLVWDANAPTADTNPLV